MNRILTITSGCILLTLAAIVSGIGMFVQGAFFSPNYEVTKDSDLYPLFESYYEGNGVEFREFEAQVVGEVNSELSIGAPVEEVVRYIQKTTSPQISPATTTGTAAKNGRSGLSQQAISGRFSAARCWTSSTHSREKPWSLSTYVCVGTTLRQPVALRGESPFSLRLLF